MTNINHDRLFKELITTFFVEFLELFFPDILEYLDRNSITFIEQELFTDLTKGDKKILDVVAFAKFREQNYSFLIHLENQASNQTDFNRRMFRYFCSLFLKYYRPIYPIALLSYDSPKRAYRDNFVVELPQFSVLNFNYKLVQLNRLDWKNFINQKTPVAAALMSKMQIATEDRPRVKAECLRLLVTLEFDPARMQLISGFVDTYLQLNQQEEQIFKLS
ncbi:MAG: flagellar assembly protein H [Cyanobacteria bacterium J06623_7]